MPKTKNETKSYLQEQVQQLQDQLRKLAAGELNQFDLQAKLDQQLRVHVELVDLSQKLHAERDPIQVATWVVESLVDVFDYQYAVFCLYQEENSSYQLSAAEGYYDENANKTLKSQLPALLLHQARKDTDECILYEKELTSDCVLMSSQVIINIVSSSGDKLGFCTFGNGQAKEAFHRPVAKQDRPIWNAIVIMTARVLENIRLYQQLKSEQASLRQARDNLTLLNEKLEQKVKDRTRELRESELNYRKLYTEAERTGELYRTLLDAAPDPIMVYDGSAAPIYVNSTFLKVFDWTLQEIRQGNNGFIPEDQQTQSQEMIHRWIQGEGVSTHESRRNKKNGDEIFVSLSGAAFSTSEPNGDGCIVHVRDITLNKQMEEEILKTRKLESVGVLAGGIAHDFNNALAGILMNTQMAQIGIHNGKDISRYLKRIQTATQASVELTQQLLTFAQGGLPILNIVPIDQSLREWATFVLRGSPSRCEFQIAEDLWMVKIDRGQISQVFHNLLQNAVQSMPQGGRISIFASNQEILPRDSKPKLPAGKYVKISIADQGQGIAKDNLPKIFDPYFTTKANGSGLGLATMFSIVNKHAGHVSVESSLGKGSVFHIFLPAVPGQERPKEKSTTNATEEDNPLRKERILFMDDEEPLREIAEEMLPELGYECKTVSNGEQAVEEYKQALNTGNRFDAVIMDLTVPGGMGGKQAVAELLKLDPLVKAIVSSGYSNDPVMAKHKDFGFRGLLAKPYKLTDLGREIESVLKA
jgi:PAS domain S-box-containing protein